jgi:glycosyltransferase involved in cell wall biosynthesis
VKIFITIPWFAPAYKAGGPIQSIVNLVSNFKEGVSYHIFCSNKDLDGRILQSISTNTWSIYSKNTTVYYTSNFSNSLLKKEVENIKPDVFFIIGIFSWQYNILPMILPFKNKKILSVRGMLHPGALSQKSLKKNIFINALKVFGISNKMVFHATDTLEEKCIQNVFGEKACVQIAGNFGKQIFRAEPILKEIGSLQLITIALISPMKNHLLVLQALKNCTSTIQYTIIGPIKDMAYWQLCLQEIETMPANVSVLYLGELIPVVIETELLKNHVFIMPSKSENFGHAISEALSAKLPVITSNFTPWNNLKNNYAGQNVDNEADAIRTAIEFFANMPNDTYQLYAENVFKYFEKNNSVEIKKEAYKNLFSTN